MPDKDVNEKSELIVMLDKMSEQVYMNNISFRDFENYCNLLINALEKEEVPNSLNYLLTLSSASVIFKTSEDAEKYVAYSRLLQDLISLKIKKSLEEKEIDLPKKLDGLKKWVDTRSTLSINNYIDYCDLFHLAILVKYDSDVCLKWARFLTDVAVGVPMGYDETIKLNTYKKMVLRYKLHLEDRDKENSNKTM